MTNPIRRRGPSREQFDKHGNFLPFAETIDDGIDFDINRIGEKIGLTPPQLLLLSYMLREIHIWARYEDDEDDKPNPRLELCIVWHDMLVAHCDLDELLSDVLESRDNIENDREIEALEKLKVRIELAIAAHKAELPGVVFERLAKEAKE